jgi:hypothetical protein
MSTVCHITHDMPLSNSTTHMSRNVSQPSNINHVPYTIKQVHQSCTKNFNKMNHNLDIHTPMPHLPYANQQVPLTMYTMCTNHASSIDQYVTHHMPTMYIIQVPYIIYHEMYLTHMPRMCARCVSTLYIY